MALDSAVWSPKIHPFVPDTLADLQTALTTALHDSTGHGTGSIDWTFSIPDKDLDFLSPGETLTATYDVTVSDGTTSSTQTVTVTMTGAADPLVVNPVDGDASRYRLHGRRPVRRHRQSHCGCRRHRRRCEQHPEHHRRERPGGRRVGEHRRGLWHPARFGRRDLYIYVANSALDALQPATIRPSSSTSRSATAFGHSDATTLTFNVPGADDAPIITAADTLGTMTEDAGPTMLVNGGFETGDLTGWSASSAAIQAAVSRVWAGSSATMPPTLDRHSDWSRCRRSSRRRPASIIR